MVTAMANINALVPRPGQVSNRTILRRLELWGCLPVKTVGDVVVVDVRGVPMKFQRGGVRKGNSSLTLHEACKLIGVSWEDFMTAELDTGDAWKSATADFRHDLGLTIHDTVSQASFPAKIIERRHEQALAEDQERSRARKAARAERHRPETSKELQEVLTPEPDPAEKETTMADAIVHDMPRRGRPPKGVVPLTTRVLEYLIREARPVATHEIAEALDVSIDQANGACNGLVKHGGSAIRVKQSVYRAADSHLQHVRLHQEAQERVEHVVAAVAAATSSPEAEPVDEDVINDVLDLLFPNGFKARHLGRIDSWREETKRLIQEVQA